MIREVWRIELGVGVGPFRLGATIAEALHAPKSRLPVRPFEISYNAVDLYQRDVIVESAEDGFRVGHLHARVILSCICVTIGIDCC